MPYKFETDKMTIPKSKDRRVKLTESQKEEIFYIYNVEKSMSQRELAAKYNVSRRLITFIIDPSKHEANLEARRKRGGTKLYYDKDKNTKNIKSTRDYKYKLYLIDELEILKPNKDTIELLDKLNNRIGSIMGIPKAYLGK